MKQKWIAIALTCVFIQAYGLPNLFAVSSSNETDTTEKNVPQKEIKEFVTAIQAIQHYYIKPVTDNHLLLSAISGMVTQLDPHSTFLDEEDLKDLNTTVSGEFVGIGVELTSEHGLLKVISPIDDTPAAKVGLKPGDMIIKVDDKLIQNMSLSDAINHIKGKKGTKVTLTVIRENEKEPLTLSMMRDTVKIQAVKSEMVLPGYGYVRLALFQGPVEQKIKEAIEGLKKQANGKLNGLILDLRGNPGGLLDVSAEVADLFLDTNKSNLYHNLIVYTKGRIADSDVTFKAKPGDIIPGVPLVVLIDKGSASASEIVAGALQDYKRAVLLGTQSFGKGSVQTVIPIGDNAAVKLTTALYYTPAGREIQAQGIEPNIIVPQLKVDDQSLKDFEVNEGSFEGHLLNKVLLTDEEKNKRNDIQVKTLALAKKDYQLYQGVLVLEGMNAMR